MSHKPIVLTEIDDLVIDVDGHEPPWYYNDPYTGVLVDAPHRRLQEIVISFYFVIPKITDEDQPVNLLTLAKGLPGTRACKPSFWDSILLHDQLGGIYAKVTYFPKRPELRVTMNVGGETRKLVGAVIEGAYPEAICGRVLELYAEISPGRIFASVHDRFLDGDFALDAVAQATGSDQHPWGASPSGNWWVMSGLRDALTVYDKPSSLPPGFGLSNLRVTLGSETSTVLDSLPYTGALDHLIVAGEEGDDEEDTFDIEDLDDSAEGKTLPETLFGFAHELDWLSADAHRWALRARVLAQETEHLAMQFP